MAVAVAVEAGFAQGAGEVAAGPFPGHLDQAQFSQGQDVGLALVLSHGLVHGGHDLFLVGFFSHVDEVDDDDAADIPQPYLVGDLLDGLQVGIEDGLVKVVLAHVTAGVDVNGHQGFGLLDDDIAPGFEPDLSLESPCDVSFYIVGVKDGFPALVKLHVEVDVGQELGQKVLHIVILGFGVNDQLVCLVGQKVAHGPEDITELGFPHAEQHFPQAGQLFFIADPFGDADMVHRGHEDHVPAGQGDMGGDPGAFGADGGFGHLDQDFLAFGEQVFYAAFRGLCLAQRFALLKRFIQWPEEWGGSFSLTAAEVLLCHVRNANICGSHSSQTAAFLQVIYSLSHIYKPIGINIFWVRRRIIFLSKSF